MPLFWLMHHSEPLAIIAGQMGLVVTIGAVLAVQPALMVEATPPGVRCTTIGLGYNISLGMLGGLSPLAATWLVNRTGTDLSPAFMIMAAAVVSFVTVWTFRQPPAAAHLLHRSSSA